MIPSELFAKVAPKVFVVQALDGQERLLSFGSGVVLKPGHVVTNKHVVDGATVIGVRHGSLTQLAILTHLDPDHDLCQVRVENLGTPPVEVRAYPSLSVGERVYAIGSPEGFDLTLSEGLISGLRRHGSTNVIQTTAPISRGSSGGGLFDSEGCLVGITTYFMRQGQSLNFAIAADLALTLERLPFAGWPRGKTKVPSISQDPLVPDRRAPSADSIAGPQRDSVDPKMLLEAIARAIVDRPDMVRVHAVDGDGTTLLELRVHPADSAKVIGKQGQVSLSIRTILMDVGVKMNRRFTLEIVS